MGRKKVDPITGNNLHLYARGPIPLEKLKQITPEELEKASDEWRKSIFPEGVLIADQGAKVEFLIPEFMPWLEYKKQFSESLVGKEVDLSGNENNKAKITEYRRKADSFFCEWKTGAGYWYDGEDIRRKF